jgi:hypothetical protein
MSIRVALIVLVLGGAGAAWSQENSEPQLPAHTKVIPPSSDVPRSIATFSGVWKGRWGDILPSILVVENIAASGDARVIYAWGGNVSLKIRSGSLEASASIKNGVLVFGQNPRFEFVKVTDTLIGRRHFNGRQDGRITMSPASLPQRKTIADTHKSECRIEPPSFVLTEANRLDDRELIRSFTGRRMIIVREHISPGRYIRGARVMRADGSFSWFCETGRSRIGPWSPCAQVGFEDFRIEGNREIGIWTVRAKTVCMTTSRSTFSACFAIHREGSQLYARKTSGTPACTEGSVTIE